MRESREDIEEIYSHFVQLALNSEAQIISRED